MKFAQAWHLFIGEGGELVPHGGRRLTVGVTREGGVYLTGDVLSSAVRLGAEAVEALGAALARAEDARSAADGDFSR